MGRFDEDGFFEPDDDDRDETDEAELAGQDWNLRDPNGEPDDEDEREG